MTKPWGLALLGLALLACPAALAHAAPDPLDNEVHLLADGGDDTYATLGGLDLQDLFAREAWIRASQAEGVVFRMVVYGSSGPAGAAAPLRLTLDWDAPGGARSVSLSSADGLNFTAEGGVVLESAMEPEGSAVQGSVQVFVDYASLGAAPGSSISGLAWRSWSGDDLRDVAPGGRPVPGSQGAAMIPEDSTTLVESLALSGPAGYTRTTVEPEGVGYRLQVQNLITTTGQHVLVEPVESAGWSVGEPDPAAASAAPGEHPTFRLAATPQGTTEPLLVHITTDLGGREAVLLRPLGDGSGAPAPTGSGPALTPGRDSPGVGALVLLGPVLVLAAFRRR